MFNGFAFANKLLYSDYIFTEMSTICKSVKLIFQLI